MVHNGIEYGDMQLICEAYDLLHNALDLSLDDISNVFLILLVNGPEEFRFHQNFNFQIFQDWNKGDLDSFLIEITANILSYKENGQHLLPQIKDNAGQVLKKIEKTILNFISS